MNVMKMKPWCLVSPALLKQKIMIRLIDETKKMNSGCVFFIRLPMAAKMMRQERSAAKGKVKKRYFTKQ